MFVAIVSSQSSTFGVHDRCLSIPPSDYSAMDLMINDEGFFLKNASGLYQNWMRGRSFFRVAPTYGDFTQNFKSTGQIYKTYGPYRGTITYNGTVAYQDTLFFIEKNYITIYECQVPNLGS